MSQNVLTKKLETLENGDSRVSSFYLVNIALILMKLKKSVYILKSIFQDFIMSFS